MVFFFNDTATTEIYTLSLHDALPIWRRSVRRPLGRPGTGYLGAVACPTSPSASPSTKPTPSRTPPRSRGRCRAPSRSGEHTSELQARQHLVCRVLLEKKKTYPLPRHY